ncbi:MAG: hypothetical protein P8129_25630 [Anaerolineae bacterium]
MDILSSLLTLASGVGWTLAYLAIIYRGFKDETYGMPLFALALNITWEFLFAFLFRDIFSLQVVINIVWFFFDLVILYTYLRYGRKEWPGTVDPRWFAPWTWLAIGMAFVTQYFASLEFSPLLAPAYSALVGNLVMSVLFIHMLVRRDGIEGQSMGIALFKWLGTAAATAFLYLDTGSNLVLALGASAFVFDLIYGGMLYHKFWELGLWPFTRQPANSSEVDTPG